MPKKRQKVSNSVISCEGTLAGRLQKVMGVKRARHKGPRVSSSGEEEEEEKYQQSDVLIMKRRRRKVLEEEEESSEEEEEEKKDEEDEEDEGKDEGKQTWLIEATREGELAAQIVARKGY